MNPVQGSDSSPHRGDRPVEKETPPPPANWREALSALVASRISLIQLESREAAQSLSRCIVRLAIVLFCVFFTWALLLFGGIVIIAQQMHCSWGWVALIAALLHLIVAFILLKVAKAPTGQVFSATRAEFQKDREWLEKLQKTRK